jgi:hypothetical protein
MRWWTAWAQLAGLTALAVAQPLLELLADSGDFLVARGNAWPDTPLVTIGLVAVPPTLAVAVEAVGEKVRPGAGRWLHAGFVGLLVAALAIQFLKEHFDPESRAITLAALAIGAGIAAAWLKTRFMPALLNVLAAAAIVVPVWFLVFSPVAATAWPQSEPGAETETETVPIVLLVLDEMSTASMMDRDDRIDRTLFPRFSELAERSTWFRNATTVADGTVHAVPAILAGHLEPEDDRLPDARSYPPSIFARLGSSWKYNVGPEPATDMCVQDWCPATKEAWPARARKLVRDLGKIMRQRLEPGPDPTTFLAVPETVSRRKETFRSWIGKLDDGRTLNLLHIEIPHSPYQYDPQGRRYSTEDTLPGLVNDTWADDPELVRQGFRRYLQQARFTDLLVGEMIDRLDRTGIWDRALVIVTADHGVSFVPGQPRRMGRPETIGEIAGIPLFVKLPGQRSGRIDDTFVTNIDVLATIGHELGTDWKLDGYPLQRPRGRDRVRVQVRFGKPVDVPTDFYEALRDATVGRLHEMR